MLPPACCLRACGFLLLELNPLPHCKLRLCMNAKPITSLANYYVRIGVSSHEKVSRSSEPSGENARYELEIEQCAPSTITFSLISFAGSPGVADGKIYRYYRVDLQRVGLGPLVLMEVLK